MFDREKTVRELEDMVANIRSQRGMRLESLVQDISARREQDLHVLGKAITLLKEGHMLDNLRYKAPSDQSEGCELCDDATAGRDRVMIYRKGRPVANVPLDP